MASLSSWSTGTGTTRCTHTWRRRTSSWTPQSLRAERSAPSEARTPTTARICISRSEERIRSRWIRRRGFVDGEEAGKGEGGKGGKRKGGKGTSKLFELETG